jgi:hypothetical protein
MAQIPRYTQQTNGFTRELNTNTGPLATPDAFGSQVAQAKARSGAMVAQGMNSIAGGISDASTVAMQIHDTVKARQTKEWLSEWSTKARGEFAARFAEGRDVGSGPGEFTKIFEDYKSDVLKHAPSTEARDAMTQRFDAMFPGFLRKSSAMAKQASDIQVDKSWKGTLGAIRQEIASGQTLDNPAEFAAQSLKALDDYQNIVPSAQIEAAKQGLEAEFMQKSDHVRIDQLEAAAGPEAAAKAIREGAAGLTFSDQQRDEMAAVLEQRALQNIRDADYVTERNLAGIEARLLRGEPVTQREEDDAIDAWAAARNKKGGGDINDNIAQAFDRVNNARTERKFSVQVRGLNMADLQDRNLDTMEFGATTRLPEQLRDRGRQIVEDEIKLRENDPATASMRAETSLFDGFSTASQAVTQAMQTRDPAAMAQARQGMEMAIGRSLTWQRDMGVARPRPLPLDTAIEHASTIRNLADAEPKKAYQEIQLLTEIYGAYASDVYKQLQELPDMKTLRDIPFGSTTKRASGYVDSYLSKIRQTR